MPFTISHAAAALPFRHTRLIPSAVVVGCFAPDFEYFIRLAPRGAFGHTLPGMIVLDLPLGLAVLWLFHRYAKEPLWAWLPTASRQRVKLGPSPFAVRSAARFALISLSILVGTATHILWDSFTHNNRWPYRHLSLLRRTIDLPAVGSMHYCELFQHASTVLGLLILLIWWQLRSRSAAPHSSRKGNTSIHKRTAFLAVSALALVAAALRAVIASGSPQIVLAKVVITAMTVFWIELVVYGMFRARRRSQMQSA